MKEERLSYLRSLQRHPAMEYGLSNASLPGNSGRRTAPRGSKQLFQLESIDRCSALLIVIEEHKHVAPLRFP